MKDKCICKIVDDIMNQNRDKEYYINSILKKFLLEKNVVHKRFIEDAISKLEQNIEERKKIINKLDNVKSLSSDFNLMVGIFSKLNLLSNKDIIICDMICNYMKDCIFKV